MNIEPTYVTFEQAKLLKEKGFDVIIETWYDKDGDYIYVNGEGSYKFYLVGEVYAPEQHQLIEWLRVVHGIWVEVNHCGTMNEFAYKICKLNKKNIKTEPHHVSEFGKGWNTPQEAYSAAFDYILNNLI